MKLYLKRTIAIGLIFAFVLAPARTVLADPVSLAELVNDKGAWDGKEVTVSGESIGDRMERGAYAWVNILDQGVAVGVWGQKELMQRITTLGDYGDVGDWVQVKGEFHLSCPEHGGDTDIHAVELQVLKPGYKVEHPIQVERVVIAMLLLALATTLGIIVFGRTQRERKHDGRLMY